MATVRVKLCGLTRMSDVEAAIEYGADALGFIFGYNSSPRNLKYEQLMELIKCVPTSVHSVVVSPASNPELVRVSEEIRPSFLQLFGGLVLITSESKSDSSKLKVIQTVHLSPEENAKSVIEACVNLSKNCNGILLDSAVPIKRKKPHDVNRASTILGGSGTVHNWKVSRQVRDALYPFPIMLAGGLNERNVQSAIREVEPFWVDVSSGIERSPGIKDRNKMKWFIEKAKSADCDIPQGRRKRQSPKSAA